MGEANFYYFTCLKLERSTNNEFKVKNIHVKKNSTK